jgi:phytoene synthase
MTVGESYAWCEQIARSRAKNFYYSFLLLSKPQRNAMCAIYAFMRYCDDLSDDETLADRASEIRQWRGDLEKALGGETSMHPVWPAFHDAVTRYKIPHEYFFDMIEGVSSDLVPQTVETFEDLYRYCYRVASVVGLTIIHIFGFDDPRALVLAEKCGIAFQLTNIIRDVKEDEGLGRRYLPAEDLRKFGVTRMESSAEFRSLMEFEGARARLYYRESAPLLGLVHKGSRRSLWALIEIYSRLLKRIEASGYDVLAQRVRVPTWEKLWILVRAATVG